MAPNPDPSLKIHPLTGECREVTGVILEAALSECANQVKTECTGVMADVLWKVVLTTCTHVQAGEPSVTATALSQALPSFRASTSAYVQGLTKPVVAKATRKRLRRFADIGGADARSPERGTQGQTTSTTKRPRAGDAGKPRGSAVGRHAASTSNPPASGSPAARPLNDPLRRVRARRVAALLNRPNWDADVAQKLAGVLHQPPEDQLLVAQSMLHVVTQNKNLSSSGCLAYVPHFAAWISSALEARLYGVIDVLCRMLLRFDAATIYARGRQDFIELGRLMKAVVPQLANAPEPSQPGGMETAQVRDQRTSCRSAAKDLFKHLFKVLKQVKVDAPTADQPQGASDGSLFSAPSPPSVVPTAPSITGEVAGGIPSVSQEGAQSMEHKVASAPGAGPPSATPGELVPSLSLNGQAEALGVEAPKLSLPKGVPRRSGSKALSTFVGPDDSLLAASPTVKDGAPDDGDSDDGAHTASDPNPLPHIPKKQPLRPPVAASESSPLAPAAASRPSGESPPVARSKQPSGLLLPRRQELAVPAAVASESPPRRTGSPRPPASPRLQLAHSPPVPPGEALPPHAQPQSGGQTSSVDVPDQPRGRSSLLSSRDGQTHASGVRPLNAIGGSVYDAITENTGLHEYRPLSPGRGLIRSALSRRAGQRTVTFGVDKAWILPALSPVESPAHDAYEAVMDADDDGGSGDVGLASKVRNKDVESEVKHFLARPVALDSFAVDALLSLTLRRAFEYFSSNRIRPDAPPDNLEKVMRDITGSIKLAELKQM